ncbi:MAG: class I SAM-dependent methyltransferase [Nanoarchaeota archaeon]
MKETNITLHTKLLKKNPLAYKRWFDEEKIFLRKDVKKDFRVLCVACGEGREMDYIKDIAKEIFGIDHDKKAIAGAKKVFKIYKNVKLKLADATNLPFANGYFDYVMCMTSFTNLGKNKISVLNEMKRVVKNKGMLAVSAYSEDAMPERLKIYKSIASVVIKEIRKDGTVIFDKSIGDSISEQFSREQLLVIFRKVKLKVLKIKKVGIGYICKLQKVNK